MILPHLFPAENLTGVHMRRFQGMILILNGTLYGTYVYDDLIKGTGRKLICLDSISQKLSCSRECVYEDGEKRKKQK